MGGRVIAGVDLQLRSAGLSCVGELDHVEGTLKDHFVPCSMASSTLSAVCNASDLMGEERIRAGASTSATNDRSTPYVEPGLRRKGLQGLSLESGEDTDSAPEGIAAGEHVLRAGFQAIENVVLCSPPEATRQPDTNVDLGNVMTQHPHAQCHADLFGQCRRLPRGPMREYRPPPALQLPDQTMMDSEFAAIHQVHENEYAPSKIRLPATLVSSPSCHASCQDGKASLDPNAKEYTPAPSPCISPVVPQHLIQQHIGVPTSYSFEPGHIFVSGMDKCSLIYGPSYAPDSGMSVYGDRSQHLYGPGSVTPASWGSIEVLDIGVHQVPLSGGVHSPAAPVGLAQPLLSSLSLQSFGVPPFQSMGLPPVGISGLDVRPHLPVSGRDHVSRAILLNGVPSSMTDEQLKIEMGKWGDVRIVVSDQKHQGFVTVHFYDLRCAKEALRDIQQQHLNKQQRMQQQFQLSQKQRGFHGGSSRREYIETAYERQDAVKEADLLPESTGASCTSANRGKGLINGVVMWAQYTVPLGAAAGPGSLNQGTLVVFNLDVDTTIEHLKSVFEAFGDVKELRETPAKKQHKFVEFYDIRDASKALRSLDGTEINGKRVKIEFSRPGGQAHKARVQLQQHAQVTSVYHPFDDSRPPLAGCGPGAVAGQPLYMNWSSDAAGAPLTLPGHHSGASFLWASSIGTPVPSLGLAVPQPWSSGGSQLQSYDYSSMRTGPAGAAGPLVVMGNTEALSCGRPGNRYMTTSFSGGPTSPCENYPSGLDFRRGISSPSGQGRGDGVSSRRKRNSSVNGAGGYGKVDTVNNLGPGNKHREGPRVGTRMSTNKLPARADVPPQYVFDEAGVVANATQRTTLMIKNIPNKYSQQMLLSLLDDHCVEWNNRAEGANDPESAYDFVYLPIDFKNRCNLGYAFVNFTCVQATMRLYRDFHLQQWEEFNSRKVCHVAYARVQGRVALEEHFKNSRFACDTDDYLPLIFRPPRNGKNSSIPATVAAIHQSSRVLGNFSQEEHVKGSRNGERRGDDYLKTVLVNGLPCTSQELEISLPESGQSRSTSLGGVRSNVPQQHR